MEVPSNSVAMMVADAEVPHITITARPGTVIQVGSYDTLTATVTNVTDPAYQWLVNGMPVANATSNVFISNRFSFPVEDSVSCVVTSNGLCHVTTHNWIYISSRYLGVTPVSAGGNLAIIPNPTKGGFTVKGAINTGNDNNVIFEITDLLGQVVYRGHATTQNGAIDKPITLGNTLANGMYILIVRSESENKVFHVVLER